MKRVSLIAGLLVCLGLYGTASATLFDVNNSNTNNTQAGWTAVDLSGINGVTFTAVGGVRLEHDDRGTLNTDGPGGDIANNDMWRDDIFADERGATVSLPAGIDIAIVNLIANTIFDVRLWAAYFCPS